MEKFVKKLREFLDNKKLKKKAQKIFVGLSCLVLIFTGLALTLPALTLEKDQAGKNNLPLSMNKYQEENEPSIFDSPGQEDEGENPSIFEDQKIDTEENQEETTDNENQNSIEENDPGGKLEGEKSQKTDLEEDKDLEEQGQNLVENPAEKVEDPSTRKDFYFENPGLRAQVSLKETYLPEEASLQVREVSGEEDQIEKEEVGAKTFFSFFRSALAFFPEEPVEEKNIEKDQVIEEAINGEVYDIVYLDISFYDGKGAHLEVKDPAQVRLEVEDLGIQVGPDEEISIAHFKEDDKVQIIEPETIFTDDQVLKDLSFETDGFSVFAIIKHGTWKRIQIKNDLYSLAAFDDILHVIDENENNTIVPKDLDKSILEEVLGREGTESPYEFNSSTIAKEYKKLSIIPAGDEFLIMDNDSDDYLSIINNNLSWSDKEYTFKFYENSKEPGRIKIFGKGQEQSPQIVVYDKTIKEFRVVNSYEKNESYIYDFIVIKNRFYYRALTNEELNNMPDEGKFIILSDNPQARTHGSRGFLTNDINKKYGKVTNAQGFMYRDSTNLKKDGELYTPSEDFQRKHRFREPEILNFKKIRTNPDVFYITDEYGNYLKLGDKSWREIEVLHPSMFNESNAYTFEFAKNINNNSNEVFLYNGISYINLDSSTTIGGWMVWNGTPANSRVKIAKLLDEPYQGDFKPKKLVDAVIPDGHYVITNTDASKLMFRRYAQDFQGSINSSDIEGRIYRNVSTALTNGSDIFKITNNKDGTYYINQFGVNGGDTRGYLRITNLGANEGYKNLAFYQDLQQKDDYKLKISRSPDDPSLFYIHNQYGSVDIFPNDVYRWRSRQGDFGSPLRLYKVDLDDNGINTSNHRFIENQTLPTEVLADISDGKYIIGNAREKPTNTKTDFKVLNVGFDAQDAFIHYSDDFKEKVPLVEGKNLDTNLFEWSIKQTQDPGYYEIYNIKNEGNPYEFTEKLVFNSDGSLGFGQTVGSGKLRIYKVDDTEDLKVIITDGEYRLRFDGKKFIAVKTDEKLTEEDYIYLGKKEEDYLSFELKMPQGYGNAPWLNDVRIQERVLVSDFLKEGGIYTFEKNIPMGYFEKLGPAGRIYAAQKDTELNNPFSNLYRRDLSSGVFPTDIDEAQDQYVEYEFLGFKISFNDKTYLIDKDAEFIRARVNDKEGIDINFNGLKILGRDGELISIMENLFIPFDSGVVFETNFLEVSAPLYFYYNVNEGITDFERGIKAEELLEREKEIEPKKLSPILAEGRILFPSGTASKETASNSALTMDYEIRDRFKSVLSVDFPDDLNGNLDSETKDQIIFNLIVDPNLSSDRIVFDDYLKDYTLATPITNNVLKGRALEWLKNSSYSGGILKYSKDNKKPIIENINEGDFVDNSWLGIDYLDLKADSVGYLIPAIMYSKTNTISVEKSFNNISEEDIELLRTGGGDNLNRFEIKLLIDQDTTGDGINNTDVLFTLAFNRTEDGNTKRTPYPQIGDQPLAYWDIERVDTFFDKINKKVYWSVSVLPGVDYKLEEKNVKIPDKDNHLYVKIEEISSINQSKNTSYMYFRHSEVGNERIITNKLNTSNNDLVKFSNNYTGGAAVIVNAFDKEDENRGLKDRKFNLYKEEDPEFIETEITDADGSILFSDLGEGSYILKEEKQDNIYKDFGEIKFDLVESQEGSDVFYKLSNWEEKEDVEFETYTITNGVLTRENHINLYYSTLVESLSIKKTFDGISIAEVMDLVKEGSGDNFKIILKGKKDGLEYSEVLDYKNSQGMSFGNIISWKVPELNNGDKKIRIFDDLGNFNLDELTIEEENYTHNRYPVTKRRAWFLGKQRSIIEYPYKITSVDFENTNIEGSESKSFDLRNIYTDTFDLMIQIRGRDFENKKFIPVENMGFKLFGDIDESTIDTKGKEFDGFGTYFQLEKPIIDDSKNQEDFKKEFFTDSNGQREIYQLAMIENNRYLLEQSKNPMATYDDKDLVYYQIENPLVIDVSGKNVSVKNYEDIKGKVSTTYDGGTLFISIDLERSNYRLPETGGLGRNSVYKVAAILIALPTALLIYKNKKIKRREQ